MQSINLATEIDRLRENLLDQTLRNPLLNYRRSARRTLQIVDELPDQIFSRLVDNQRRLQFSPLPPSRITRDNGTEDAGGDILSTDPYSLDLPTIESTKRSSDRGRYQDDRLQTNLPAEKLDSLLKSIEQQARSTIDETGVNYLHLAIGFLGWTENDSSKEPKLAPLVLIPVSLERALDPRSGHYRFTVGWNGDEVSHNLSLIRKLESDFGIRLPSYEDSTSPEEYLESIQECVALKPNWTVIRQSVLGFFSFHKLSMYVDLDPSGWRGENEINANSLLRTVILGREGPAEPQGVYARDYDIDGDSVAPELMLPLEADSSQHSALCDIASGRNLVIEGPPGTGKSQTIANAIANAIASGKSVLFVAEKLAALEVVARRLEVLGLDPYCLELHSDAANPRNVIASLQKRLDAANPKRTRIDSLKQRCDSSKQELNEYVRATAQIVAPHQEPLYSLLWRIVEMRRVEPVYLREAEFAPPKETGELERGSMALESFARSLREMPQPRLSPWWGFFPDGLNPHDLQPVESALRNLRSCANSLVSVLDRLSSTCRSTRNDWAATIAQIDSNQLRQLLATSGLPKNSIEVKELNDQSVRETAPRLCNEVIESNDLIAQLERQALIPGLEFKERLSQAEPIFRNLSLRFSDDITLESISKLRSWCSTTLIAFSEVLRIASLLENAGFGPTRTISEIQEHRIALMLARHPVVDGEIPFTPELFFDAAKATYVEASQKGTWLAEQCERLEQLFHLPSCPKREELFKVAKALRPYVGSRFPWLWRGYRKANHTLRTFARPQSKATIAEFIDAMELLDRYQRELELFDGTGKYAKVLGPRFQGVSTDWSQVKTLLDWVHTAKQRGLNYQSACSLLTAARKLGDQLRASAIERALQTFHAELANANSKQLGVPLSDIATWPLSSIKDLLSSFERLCDRFLEIGGVFSTGRTTTLGQMKCALALASRLEVLLNSIGCAHTWRRLPEKVRIACTTSPREVLSSLSWHQHLTDLRLPSASVEHILSTADTSLLKLVADLSDECKTLIGNWNSQRNALASMGSIAKPWLSLNEHEKLNVAVGEVIDILLRSMDSLPAWAALSRSLAHCDRCGVAAFANSLIDGRLSADNVVHSYQFTSYMKIAEAELSKNGLNRSFSRQNMEGLREVFQKTDRELVSAIAQEISLVSSRKVIPEGNSRGRVSELTELSLIRHEMQKQRRHCRIRDLMVRAKNAIQAMKPCFLMSPLSVATYIPPGSMTFDLVIMDEASQIKPEDAIGAILRAKQLVVVGDPKQLPPTSFFDRMSEDLDDEESTQFDNTESILQVAMKSFHPYRRLRWHYRSRHESLIQFSNQKFYDNDLVIFPAPNPHDAEFGIKHHFVPNGQFTSGCNPVEAQLIVKRIIEHARTSKESLGVGAFNSKQAEIIRELLDKECEADPKAALAIERLRNQHESLFIKNLENLQGDERDVIFISYTYGPDPATGKVYQRFGPINFDTGWRRLNVLVSRARRRMEVFSSLRPSDILGGPAKSRGVNAYRDFLEYAKTGVMVDRGEISDRGIDSPFEEAVIRAIEGMGVQAIPQVGVAGFFIDIGIRPKDSTEFILGIECDGANYHSSKSARDRDRLREEIIRDRGWRLHRIWSTDWYLNQRHEEQRLRDVITKALERHQSAIARIG